jgi:probable DNA metabolism protein
MEQLIRTVRNLRSRGFNGCIQPGLFEECEEIPNDANKAERVWQGLRRHRGSDSRSQIYQAYLTAASDVETLIYRNIRMGVQIQSAPEDPQAPATRLAIERLSQEVRREAHRMKGLVHFGKMENDGYLEETPSTISG